VKNAHLKRLEEQIQTIQKLVDDAGGEDGHEYSRKEDEEIKQLVKETKAR
jgi:hypothetical protein